MKNTHEQKRIEALFDDLDKLAADPANTHEVKIELDEMRRRLHELEVHVLNARTASTPSDEAEGQRRSLSFSLYERDRAGYVYSNEKIHNLYDSEYKLPEFKDSITSPLRVSGNVIGEMQIAQPQDHQLSAEEVMLANSIAQQASLQIQSLRLLSEAERSRAEAEIATRKFIHEGWDAYLDAVNRNERIGYTYDQSSVSSFDGRIRENGGVKTTVRVMDEHIGTLYIQPDPNQPLTTSDNEMINSIASQVAQQVENIRLLADASRARSEAEGAIRRLAHDNWQKFSEDRDEEELAFAYDTLQVKPLKEMNVTEEFIHSQPLIVNGEPIGRLAIGGLKSMPAGAAGMLSSIAAQASIHLETLRLSEELQKRARELQELDRLKSAFLANMSHELRTPLNSILGFTDVMLEGLDGDLTEYMNNDLRLIQKNGQHLLHLINDVLDMAKIESGRMNLHPEKFVLHELLDEVTSITSALASEKNTALFIEEDSDHEVEIFADNTRIRQVMINLVNNAIKFTVNGKISLRTSMLDSARVLVTVKDTGLGIPPEKLESIFEEFSQVDTSTTRKVGGTGLGLPISRRLVEMHGGRLWAESTGVEGEGSTFFVELPIEARITEVIEKQEK